MKLSKLKLVSIALFAVAIMIFVGCSNGSGSSDPISYVPNGGSSTSGGGGNSSGSTGGNGTGDSTDGNGGNTDETTKYEEVVAPSNLKFTNQVLTWDETGTASLFDYKIYCGDTKDFTPSSENCLTSKTFGVKKYTAPKDKVNKWFKVSAAKRNSSEEKFSEAVQFTNYKQLDTPENFRVENKSLKWDAVEDAYDYYVYESSNSSVSTASYTKKTSSSGLTSLSPAQNYYYIVTAVDGAGNESEPSTVLNNTSSD